MLFKSWVGLQVKWKNGELFEHRTLSLPLSIENVISSLEENKKPGCLTAPLRYLFCSFLISHASKVMLKILQARLQQYVNHELSMFKLVLEKAEEPKIKLPTSTGSWKKQESSRKTSISALLTMPKPLTVWITINCGKF